MRMKTKFLALLVATVFSATANALPEDREKPIHVSADSASIDEKSGRTIYLGDVKITQGTLLIEAERVELERGEKGVERVTAFGKQAHFRQKPDTDKPYTDAWGDTIIYKVEKEHLTLQKNAKVISDKDTFTGSRILYNLKTSVVDAYSDGKDGSSGRVEMIIQPKKDKDAQ